MAAKNSDLFTAWERFDDTTKLQLTIGELDRIYRGIETLRDEMQTSVEELRKEVQDGFKAMEKRQNRNTALFLSILGSVIVGLTLLVYQISAGK